MKATNTILTVLLVGSLFSNFFFFIREGSTLPCDNKGRFSNEEKVGALRLKETEAGDLVKQYRIDFPPESNNNHPTGFVFTKRMFDEVFEDQSFNSVTLDLVTYNDNISLVVKGFNTVQTKIDGVGDSRTYIIQSFCPMDCSIW